MEFFNRLKSAFIEDDAYYPSVQVDEELHEKLMQRCEDLDSGDGGPLLLVRPPKESEGMDGSISIYETLHNPRESKIGLGKFAVRRNNAHTHAHEIWYHQGKMQFFLRPQTQVNANQVKRQVVSNYPNAEIREVDQKFPPIEPGEHISIAELGLKRDFYFPVKAKLCTEDEFELDPYGDITSDMVVEEDETSSGDRVEAKDCKLMVQTTFEAARDVWHKDRPYGMDVSEMAANMKESEVHGGLIRGYDTRSASELKRKTARIIDALQGTKGYYINIRIIAISPYEEIAKRRCYTVAGDFEKYYNSITQQGLQPIEMTKDEMRNSLLKAAEREHKIRFRDRFMSNGKFLQPVEALAAMAHIPNEDINTPVVDWAKQNTGPGSPAETTQIEEQERESADDSGGVETINPDAPAQTAGGSGKQPGGNSPASPVDATPTRTESDSPTTTANEDGANDLGDDVHDHIDDDLGSMEDDDDDWEELGGMDDSLDGMEDDLDETRTTASDGDGLQSADSEASESPDELTPPGGGESENVNESEVGWNKPNKDTHRTDSQNDEQQTDSTEAPSGDGWENVTDESDSAGRRGSETNEDTDQSQTPAFAQGGESDLLDDEDGDEDADFR